MSVLKSPVDATTKGAYQSLRDTSRTLLNEEEAYWAAFKLHRKASDEFRAIQLEYEAAFLKVVF